MAGDAAQNAATRINPSEEKLSQIDSPAADNTWHDVPSVTGLRDQATDMYNKNKPFSKKDAKDATADATATAQDAPADASKQGTAENAAGNAAGKLATTAKGNVPEETQAKAKESANKTREQARDYLGKKMPKERRDQTIWRLKKMIVEIQGHDDCMSKPRIYDEHLTNMA